MTTRFCFASLLCILAFGCGDDDTTIPDSGDEDVTEDTAEDATADVVVDVGTDPFADTSMEPSYYFGPCTHDSQCPDDGICRRSHLNAPMGSCTRPCDERRDCTDDGRYHWCRDVDGLASEQVCEQHCVNSSDCGRDSYICADIGAEEFGGVMQTSFGYCRGLCRRDSDCGAGSECNEQSGECVPYGQDTNVGGQANDPCESDDDCQSGSCFPEEIDGTGTGEIGGRCTGPCAIPAGYNGSDFYLGDSFPTTSCPSNGDVCIPVGALTRGSEGTCLSECVEDSDCREGRTCLRTVAGKTFDNGVCVTVNCSEDTDCPDDYECDVRGSGDDQRGFCVAD